MMVRARILAFSVIAIYICLPDFLISIVTLSPTLIAIFLYSLILILKVGESVGKPPPMALQVLLQYYIVNSLVGLEITS